MKVLLVAPLFPPDTGVSTLRMRFFRDSLSKEYEVDVLKLGDVNHFTGSVKLIDRNLFVPFFRAVINRGKIFGLVRQLLRNYDLVIVSAAPYGLYEVAHAAKKVGIPYILDLRDLPDLTTSEQKGVKPLWWLNIKTWLIFLYIKTIAKSALALLCVGAISAAVMQKKLKGSVCRVINLHNGFEKADLEVVRQHAPVKKAKESELVVGCVGNVYRFRDTEDLRHALAQLNRRKERIILRHWGKLCPSLSTYLQGLTNIKYEARATVPRNVLLSELHTVDCFLLACADDLIWEPTTSVFDYILFDKPVIFTGLRNNEAYLILKNTGTHILESDDLATFDFKSRSGSQKSLDVLQCYSREFYIDRLLTIIRKLESL